MAIHVVMFTQPGCFSCELMRVFLQAREVEFEERDITADSEARRVMTEECDSQETPTLLVESGETAEIVVGFDPARLDQLLAPAPSSDSVNES